MIYTLYSFKGGVGRSMALANLAECFCEKGLKVLMIDWDLEAPGLESYFYSAADGESAGAELARLRGARGLLEMLLDYKAKYPELAGWNSKPEVRETQDRDELEKRARDVKRADEIIKKALENLSNVPEDLRRVERPSALATGPAPLLPSATVADQGLTRSLGTKGARAGAYGEVLDKGLAPLSEYLQLVHKSGAAELWLLTAGARSPENFANYANAVQDFDWIAFLAAFEGREYLEWLRRKLATFDVVLIDSRTGVTEMGGICTRQMADAVVSFCAPNLQNVDGVARIRKSFDTDAAKKARYGRGLDVLVIPTRIDDFESALVNQFSKEFQAKIEAESLLPEELSGLDRPLWNLQVPYIPKYNYLERLVIGPRAVEADPPTVKLIKAYRRIAVHLAVLAEENTRIRLVFQSEIASMLPRTERARPPKLAPTLPGSWVERPIELAKVKQALLECSQAPNGGRLAVWARPGMGATSLVARACADSDVLSAFPDGILWLTMDQPWSSEQTQDWLRASFTLPRGGDESALADALAERRFLFVVDDVWDLDQLETVFGYGRRCTRAIITRDLDVASRFAERLVSVGPLTADESARLAKVPLDGSQLGDDPLLRAMREWPLGATLLRNALERRLAQGDEPPQAWNTIRNALERQGITALDQPAAGTRSGSVALSLRESVGRLTPGQRKLLFTIAAKGAQGWPNTPEGPDGLRLQALGLIQDLDGMLRADERVYRWLLSRGELDEAGQQRKQRERKDAIENGYAILRGKQASLEETETLAYRAKDLRSFSLARRLFALARQHPGASALPPTRRLKLLQQHALCTYKDEDVVADERYSRAFDILNQGDLPNEPSQETLGLAGSIHKSMWRITGQRRDLEHSLGYYQRGAQGELSGDFGYTRINAAFVLDLLASQEQKDCPDIARQRRERAAEIREEIVAKLPVIARQSKYAWLKNEWWYGATLAEASFGLGRFVEARYWLREALALDPPAWQLETTTRQLAALAKAQGVDLAKESAASRAIGILVDDAPPALTAISMGKVGLALSGGGFRASLFHIGVLARLAELDFLRHVEVLSCVSGGSIVGAHYYLEVRRLLQQKADSEITREDYIQLVHQLERNFLAGVQKNLRTRLFAAWGANLLSLFRSGYTRTRHLGELFERHLYAYVGDGESGVRWLNQLKIQPKESGGEFNPKLDNWRRCCKVPILLLNATTLNTGHVWQFAVNWMGEPAISVNNSVDCNDLLRRMYYDEAPAGYQGIRLGDAVAASACVPALFDPIELQQLYPLRTLRLVDGGVHDNQGVAGLLEQECSVLIVSDASGQTNSERDPSAEAYSVPIRSNNILMARVRETEFQHLQALHRSSALGALVFLHLKKDLEVNHVDWLGCRDPYGAFDESGKTRRDTTLTSYDIPKTVQSRLAGLRTDLDTFSDAEAYALMLSGYRMAAVEFDHLPATNSSRERWRFLAIAPTVDRAPDSEAQHEHLLRLLGVGACRSFRVWRLVPALWLIPVVLAAAAIAGWRIAARQVGGLSGSNAALAEQVASWIGLSAIGLVAVLLIARWRPRGRKSLTVLLTGLVMVTVRWLVARIHLYCFDRLYLRLGAVRHRDAGVDAEQLADGRYPR